MDGSGPAPDDLLSLLDVSLHTEDRGRIGVPLEDEAEPLVLAEGTVVSLGLTFRLGEAVDGLVFEEEHARDGGVVDRTRTVLGGFRRGGPYEVWLPPRRLPIGRAHCGLYRVGGRLTDGSGRELARTGHRLRLVHVGATPPPHPAPPTHSAPPPHPAAPSLPTPPTRPAVPPHPAPGA
ncbi:Rho GDP-dissociation inhibitor [Streptomyces filamentosus]|uniref:hypothetical protein n=1 Tax=Streptomyces filamentosus TaxID=67294 RepID=UPI0038308ACE